MSLRYPSGFISAGFNPLEVPNAPTIGTASVASATSVSVTFTAPSNVGGSAITGFVATAKKTSDSTTISGTGSSSPITISGLTTGDAYTVTVAAINSYGLGVSSAASNSVTPQNQRMFSWGRNYYGNLGLDNTTNYYSPKQVGSLTTWNKISSAGGQFCSAIKLDGTLWAWGRNTNGQLGQNDTTNRSSPVQVGALTTWSQVAVYNNAITAITSSGTMFSWGSNSDGRLGTNNTTYRSSPVQVGALTTWSQVSRGGGWCLALRTDGTMWSWGLNQATRLGLNLSPGLETKFSSPVQIGALTDWAKISCGEDFGTAITTTGELYVWGGNGGGRLGLGDTTNRGSPVQVGILTNWAQVSAGAASCVALKTDGTIWSWGTGSFGRLGHNNTTYRSSPVQIGALATWSQVTAGGNHCLANKTDGTLWAWGRSNYGQLGQNDTTDRSSPVQVGALTDWVRTTAGYNMSLAIKG